jgi:hypothetical protein
MPSKRVKVLPAWREQSQGQKRIRGHAAVPVSQECISNATSGDTTQQAKPHSPSRAHCGGSIHLSFVQAFGVSGLALLLVLLMCIAWTTWLIMLTVAPNWTANQLMKTADYDEGNFWLIVETDFGMKVLSLFGLTLVVLCYLYVLLKMLIWRNSSSSNLAKALSSRVGSSLSRWTRLSYGSRSQVVLSFWQELTGFQGTYRKFWVRAPRQRFLS